MEAILSLASLDCTANTLTCSATTAKPLPSSPALAASIDAFKASRLVCAVILEMVSANVEISFIQLVRLSIDFSVVLDVTLMEPILFTASSISFTYSCMAPVVLSAIPIIS